MHHWWADLTIAIWGWAFLLQLLRIELTMNPATHRGLD
jgi:hypothetical protein